MLTQVTRTPRARPEPEPDGTRERSAARLNLWVIVAVVVLGVAAVGVAIWAPGDSDDGTGPADTVFVAAGTPSEFAVDLAERWGRAMESGDTATISALYSAAEDGGGTIVDRFVRAVWTDADAAIESITSGNDFLRFEVVAVEEFLPYASNRPGSGMIVAAYELNYVHEAASEALAMPWTVVVVFHNLNDGLIGDSDIYFPYWSSFVTGEAGGGYPQRTEADEEGWLIID